MTDVVVVLSTVSADFDAAGLARTLVEHGVAACVSVIPGVTSVYRWRGNVETAREQQLVIKTTSARIDALRAALDPLHPSDVPEFLVIPVSGGGEDYLQWVRELDD